MSAHLGEQEPPVGLRALARPLGVVPGHARGHVVMWLFHPILRFECFSSPGAFIRNESWFMVRDLESEISHFSFKLWT